MVRKSKPISKEPTSHVKKVSGTSKQNSTKDLSSKELLQMMIQEEDKAYHSPSKLKTPTKEAKSAKSSKESPKDKEKSAWETSPSFPPSKSPMPELKVATYSKKTPVKSPFEGRELVVRPLDMEESDEEDVSFDVHGFAVEKAAGESKGKGKGKKRKGGKAEEKKTKKMLFPSTPSEEEKKPKKMEETPEDESQPDELSQRTKEFYSELDEFSLQEEEAGVPESTTEEPKSPTKTTTTKKTVKSQKKKEKELQQELEQIYDDLVEEQPLKRKRGAEKKVEDATEKQESNKGKKKKTSKTTSAQDGNDSQGTRRSSRQTKSKT